MAETRKYRNCDYPIEVPYLKGEENCLKSDQKIEGLTRVPATWVVGPVRSSDVRLKFKFGSSGDLGDLGGTLRWSRSVVTC